jgi:hypothetical protein
MIYILHFDTPLHHARHYVGYCADGTLDERLARHRAGRGSRLMAAIEEAGIGYTIALTHAGDRRFERAIKRAKNTSRFCPLCRSLQIEGGMPRAKLCTACLPSSPLRKAAGA